MFRQNLKRPLLCRLAKRFFHDPGIPSEWYVNITHRPSGFIVSGDPRKEKRPRFPPSLIHRHPQRQKKPEKRFCRGCSICFPIARGNCHTVPGARISNRTRSYKSNWRFFCAIDARTLRGKPNRTGSFSGQRFTILLRQPSVSTLTPYAHARDTAWRNENRKEKGPTPLS